MKTLGALLALVALYVGFPVIAGGILLGLATLIKPDRLDPDLAGWIYFGALLAGLAAAYMLVRFISERNDANAKAARLIRKR